MNEMRPPRAKPRFADISAITRRYDRVARPCCMEALRGVS